MSDKRRANLAKILINMGSIVFGTMVLPMFTGSFEMVIVIRGAVVALISFAGAIWIEK